MLRWHRLFRDLDFVFWWNSLPEILIQCFELQVDVIEENVEHDGENGENHHQIRDGHIENDLREYICGGREIMHIPRNQCRNRQSQYEANDWINTKISNFPSTVRRETIFIHLKSKRTNYNANYAIAAAVARTFFSTTANVDSSFTICLRKIYVKSALHNENANARMDTKLIP